MSPDSYPLDYTGYGPTGVGNAPTAAEMRMQAMNRFHTDRLSSAMQFIDPYVAGATRMTMQTLTSAGNSPQEVRRAMYQSAGGQMALDAAMMARRGGYLGYGDPVNYAANIAAGVAGGGFRATMGGPMGYSNGIVSGQGHIAERVSMSFAKGLMQNLYGEGSANPGRLHGFDMEEASGVFRTLARRGVIGHAAHVEYGADMQTKLAAARQNAVDPSIKAGLDAININGLNEAESLKEINKVINSTDNDKLKKELNDMVKSPMTVVINEGATKKMGDLVKSVTRGMASLSDIYGELTAPELQQKLEQVSGMRITNTQQAREAHAMVNRLRGAAEISGMDPRAFMDYSSHMQGMLQGEVARAGGFDSRSATQRTRVTAVMHEQIMSDAAIASKLANQNVMAAREAGIDAADAPTLDEIYADKAEGRVQFLDRYKSVAMTQGGADNFSGAQRKRVDELMRQFSSTTDPRERQMIASQLEGEWGSLFGGSFANAASSKTAAHAIANAYSNPQNARAMEAMAAAGRNSAVNVRPLVGRLEEMGAGGGIDMANRLRDKLGVSGMTAFMQAASAQDKRDILAQAGITGAEADEFMSRFVGADGGLKNADGFKQLASQLSRAGWEGGMSTYDQTQIGVERMNMIGADSARKKLSAADGLSVKGIASALVTGGISGINDAETVGLALDALGDDLPAYAKGAKGKYVTGLDFSKGLTKENLAELQKIHGKDLGLAKKLGFGSEEEMIDASKNNMNVTADALNILQTDADYAGLNLSGDQFGMTAMDSELLTRILDSGQLDADMRAKGGKDLLARSMGLEGGNDFKMSLLGGDKFGKVKGKWTPWKSDDRVEMTDGLGRVMNLSNLIAGANGTELSALSAYNDEADLVGAMQAQYDELERAKKAGGKNGGELRVDYRDETGKAQSASIDTLMKSLKQTMERLDGASGGGSQNVEEMRVKYLKVENSTTND